MAFVAINARADVEGSKKGKLTPAQNAQVNAWSLSQKTGVFDILGKCEATLYNQSSSFSLTFSNGGYISICGRIVECEAGTSITVPKPSAGRTEKGYVVARYNLQATGNSEFEVVAITTIPVTNDLNSSPTTGKYEFVLYEYNVDASGLATINRPSGFAYIQSNEDTFKKIIADLTSGATKVANIEQRLTNLGFRSGSVTVSGGTATTNIITRQGNYVIGKIVIEGASQKVDTAYTMTLPSEFRPKEQVSFLGGAEVRWVSTGGASLNYEAMNVTISPNGTISLVIASSPYQSTSGFFTKTNLNFGFEANPIT